MASNTCATTHGADREWRVEKEGELVAEGNTDASSVADQDAPAALQEKDAAALQEKDVVAMDAMLKRVPADGDAVGPTSAPNRVARRPCGSSSSTSSSCTSHISEPGNGRKAVALGAGVAAAAPPPSWLSPPPGLFFLVMQPPAGPPPTLAPSRNADADMGGTSPLDARTLLVYHDEAARATRRGLRAGGGPGLSHRRPTHAVSGLDGAGDARRCRHRRLDLH